MRDWGLLEAACARPRMGFGDYEAFSSLLEKAASLLEAICSYHPFIDGNKRTAWLACMVFLKLNGRLVEASVDDAVEFMLKVAAGDLALEEIVSWLESHTVK